jgi:hypothetical protein
MAATHAKADRKAIPGDLIRQWGGKMWSLCRRRANDDIAVADRRAVNLYISMARQLGRTKAVEHSRADLLVRQLVESPFIRQVGEAGFAPLSGNTL